MAVTRVSAAAQEAPPETPSQSTKSHRCKYCNQTFSSRNKLFAHFQNSACTERAIADGMPVSGMPVKRLSERKSGPVPNKKNKAESRSSTGRRTEQESGEKIGERNGESLASQASTPCPPILPEINAVQQPSSANGRLPSSAETNILILGECDFSFSVSVSTKLIEQNNHQHLSHHFNLFSTAYSSAPDEGPGRETKLSKCIQKNVKLLQKRGCVVKFGVDATDILGSFGKDETSLKDTLEDPLKDGLKPTLKDPLKGTLKPTLKPTLFDRMFDRIIFCFPRASAARGRQVENEILLERFFRCALPLLKGGLGREPLEVEPGGQIVLLLNNCQDCRGEEGEKHLHQDGEAGEEKSGKRSLDGTSTEDRSTEDSTLDGTSTICQPQDEFTNDSIATSIDQYLDWNVQDIAHQCGLERVGRKPFEGREFPQYQPRAWNGEAFRPGVRNWR